MAEDSTLLPNVDEPPGNASLTGDGSGSAYDYSPHLNRLVVSIEQLTLSTALLYDKINSIDTSIDQLSTTMLGVLQTQQAMSNTLQTMSNTQTSIYNLLNDKGANINFKDLYAALGYSSLIRLYKEDGVDIEKLISDTEKVIKGL